MEHLNEELALLRAERIKAIQSCDFSRARQIDNQLQHLKDSINSATREDHQRECQTIYEAEKEAVLLDAERKYSESTAEIYEAKNLYQRKMVELQKKHAIELEYLAEQLAKDLELAMIREVPESTTYRRQAQASAIVQDYDNAEAMMKISENVREETMNERQLEVQRQYDVLRNQMIERHIQEDKTCEMMHFKNIENIRRRHQKSNEILRKRLDFRAYSLKAPVVQSDIQISELELSDDEIDTVKNKKSVSAPVSGLARRSSLEGRRTPLVPNSPTANRSPKSPASKKSSKTTSPKSPKQTVSPKKVVSPKL